MLNSNPSTERRTAKSAYGRVSSTGNVSSLDWLAAVTVNAVSINSLIELSEPTYSGSGYILKYTARPWQIWFKQFKDKRVMFTINPSTHFSSGWELLDTFREELGEWALDARISRLDCAVTLPIPFDELFTGLDFGSKRYVESFIERPSGRTVYIGRKGRRNETTLYDKRKQSLSVKGEIPIKHDCIRAEINSVIKKGMKVKHLPSLVTHSPFRHMTRNKVVFIEPNSRSPSLWLRFGELKILMEREGLTMARRTLDKRSGHNFISQYGDFFELKRVNPSLDHIFQKGMAEFFKQ